MRVADPARQERCEEHDGFVREGGPSPFVADDSADEDRRRAGEHRADAIRARNPDVAHHHEHGRRAAGDAGERMPGEREADEREADGHRDAHEQRGGNRPAAHAEQVSIPGPVHVAGRARTRTATTASPAV